jgi:hypothetical protein
VRGLKNLCLLYCILFGAICQAQDWVQVNKLNPNGVNEPSDLLYLNGIWYACGNKAFLYESKDLITWDETVVNDFDLEAITTDGKYIFISEETYQRIWVYDPVAKKVMKQIPFKHGGGRNEGIEAMTYLPKSNQFLLVSEKDPCVFYLTDEKFQIEEQFQLDGISEVSSVGFYNNKLYVLSDEDATLFELDWELRKVVSRVSIPLINPEGFVWKDGDLWVCSDDMKRIIQLSKK